MHALNPGIQSVCDNLFPSIPVHGLNTTNISELIAEKHKNHEFFFGIEVFTSISIIDYSKIFKVLPLFTSVVWFGPKNAEIKPISNAPAFNLANKLRLFGPVLSNVSCYKMTKVTLMEIVLSDKKPANIFAIRGDQFENGQCYEHSANLVKELRLLCGDDISIGVGGYPDTHPAALSRQEDLRHLKNKVEHGANFIITQFSFSEENIKQFVVECRAQGINVPIIIGIFVPRNLNFLKRLCDIANVSISNEEFNKYAKYGDDDDKFEEYANLRAVQLIRNLFNSNLGIYGVQFFTVDYFENIRKIVKEIF